MRGDYRPPSKAPYMYAAGNVVVTTNASGRATISFGRTFPAVPTVTAIGGNGELVTIPGIAVTTTGFTAAFFASSPIGQVMANLGVRCLWQAFPAT